MCGARANGRLASQSSDGRWHEGRSRHSRNKRSTIWLFAREDVQAPSSALQCTQRQQPRREHNNLRARLLFFPSACLSGPIRTIEERDVKVCRYCTCDVSLCMNAICKYGHISYPCHLRSTCTFPSAWPWMWTRVSRRPCPSPSLYSPTCHLLARQLERLLHWHCVNRADNDCNVCEQDKHAYFIAVVVKGEKWRGMNGELKCMHKAWLRRGYFTVLPGIFLLNLC